MPPGEHGILGFAVKLPGSDRVLNHIGWRDDPPPTRWQPVPTWFERLAQAGVGTRAVLPAAFIGSGLTEAAYRVDSLPPDAVLLVTADHGGTNVPAAARVDMDADPQLAAGVRVVAGDIVAGDCVARAVGRCRLNIPGRGTGYSGVT